MNPSETPRSHYFTTAMARRAVSMALPMIEACRRDATVVGSGFLYLVIMAPDRTPQNSSFDDAILYEHACGDRDLWDADYAGFARAKALLSWRTGMDAHRVQTLMPHLLQSGDSLLWGSVCVNGIVVAASGAFPWFDEAFAGTVAFCLQALAKEARAAEPDRPALE